MVDETESGAGDVGDDGLPITRTRAIITAPSVVERIEHIMGMMARLEWVRGRSAKPLAELWGLSVNTVEHNSVEASRIVKQALDREELSRDIGIIARRQMLLADAENDRAGLDKMMGKLMDLSGARAPTKVETEVTTVTLDDLEARRKLAEQNESDSNVDDSGSDE